MNNQFKEALALAQLLSEKTGVSVQQALTTLAEMATDGPDLRPFDKMKFTSAMQSAPSGLYTSREICQSINMEMPRGSKVCAYMFEAAGWERQEERRDGLTLWRKP